MAVIENGVDRNTSKIPNYQFHWGKWSSTDFGVPYFQTQTVWLNFYRWSTWKTPSFFTDSFRDLSESNGIHAGPTRPGKRLHKTMGKPWENHGKMVIYMEHHHFSWVNRLFLWSCSIAMTDITRGSFSLDAILSTIAWSCLVFHRRSPYEVEGKTRYNTWWRTTHES